MSFLGVKVILFLVIPLIIKEKSNASALRGSWHERVWGEIHPHLGRDTNASGARHDCVCSQTRPNAGQRSLPTNIPLSTTPVA